MNCSKTWAIFKSCVRKSCLISRQRSPISLLFPLKSSLARTIVVCLSEIGARFTLFLVGSHCSCGSGKNNGSMTYKSVYNKEYTIKV